MPSSRICEVVIDDRSVPFSIAPMRTAVDEYWTRHTVRARRFRTRRASERNLEWRLSEYPLFREFSGLWGDRDGEVILDYGCGPGNDLTGFALNTGPAGIGFDVSQTALHLAAQRLDSTATTTAAGG